ncbi:glycosyltransferase [Perlucidibaca aquatica]|uniref:glycosyltransferase n=1 Tax=Perlucidibaca aquatica TaxID=1852776 RepID=UPI00083A701D|nr:glycosyltransferase [Perlucidibaca aquatica]
MKILQVISTVDLKAGGPIEGMIQQGLEMQRLGHEVHALTLDIPGLSLDPRLEARSVIFLGPSQLNYGFNIRLEPWLIEHGASYDVVIVHGMWQYHGLAVRNAAAVAGFPYVIFLHGMLDPWFKHAYPLKHAKKWLYWAWAEYRVLRDASLVLFTTQEELLLARQSFWLYRARERLVGYGIRDRAIPRGQAASAFLQQFPALQGKRCLLYLSRIHPKKGCDLLIQALPAVLQHDPALHLIMAGPDSAGWVAELQDMAEKVGVANHVTFTGMLTGDVKWGAYDIADAFVLPSHQENFGIVVAEALASGLPVLTTHQVNIWREIEAAGAGVICPDTLEGTVIALEQWLLMPTDAQQRMREHAVACFHKHFEIVQVTGNLINALSDVAEGVVPDHTFQGSFF